MRKHLFRLALAAIATTLAAHGALAQGSAMDGLGSSRLVTCGIGGGVAVPVSDARDAFKNGFAGQSFVRLNTHWLPFSPRVDFTFSQFDLKVTPVKTGVPSTAGTTGTGQLMAGLANLQFPLLNSGPIRPYLVAGVGAYNVKTEVDGSGTTPGTSDTSTRFGINGGAGVAFRLTSMVSGFIEGRVDNVYTEAGMIATDQVQVVPVTFGLVF